MSFSSCWAAFLLFLRSGRRPVPFVDWSNWKGHLKVRLQFTGEFEQVRPVNWKRRQRWIFFAGDRLPVSRVACWPFAVFITGGDQRRWSVVVFILMNGRISESYSPSCTLVGTGGE